MLLLWAYHVWSSLLENSLFRISFIMFRPCLSRSKMVSKKSFIEPGNLVFHGYMFSASLSRNIFHMYTFRFELHLHRRLLIKVLFQRVYRTVLLVLSSRKSSEYTCMKISNRVWDIILKAVSVPAPTFNFNAAAHLTAIKDFHVMTIGLQ